jgi:hypothetical protein
MMFGIIPPPMEWKPRGKWFVEDNRLTGINADFDYEGSARGMIMPPDVSEREKELMLWAWEVGYSTGQYVGKQDLQRDIRRLIGITHV